MRRGGGPGAARPILSRLGPDGRDESAALAAHPEGAPLRSRDLVQAVRIAHDGGADLEICRRGDDQVWALRANDEPPEEWLGAAVARRCHGVWAPDAPEWLARLAAVAVDEPAEMARFVVERVEALQYFRLLIARRSSAPSRGSTRWRPCSRGRESYSMTATGARSRTRAARPPRLRQRRSASASRFRTPRSTLPFTGSRTSPRSTLGSG